MSGDEELEDFEKGKGPYIKQFRDVLDSNVKTMDILPTIEDLIGLDDSEDYVFEIPSSLFTTRAPHDGTKWNNRKSSSNHRIRYSSIVYENSTYLVADCKAVDDNRLSRIVFKGKDRTYIRYAYSLGVFEPPQKLVRARLTENDKLLIRDALEHRTVSDAQKFLSKRGFIFDEVQIRNQKKYVKESITSKTGPRLRTDAANLVSLKKLASTGSEYFTYTDENGEDLFRFCYVDEEALSVFINGCPSKLEVQKQRKMIDELAKKSKKAQRDYIQDFCRTNPFGSVFNSSVTVDTTFSLGDYYVTVVIGELSNFTTAASGKNRTICLGYMLHSTKEQLNHDAFAKFIGEKLKKFSHLKKGCPTVLMDGEHSLEVYAKAFDTSILKCARHLMDNIVAASSRTEASEVQKILFGVKTNNNILTSGILLSFSIEELEHRIESSEEKLTEKMVKWLMDRSSLLFDYYSTFSQLRCGQLLQFQTTNAIECYNNVLKGVIKKPLPADQIVTTLSNEMNDSINELAKSVFGMSKTIICKKATEISTAPLEVQKKMQDDLGFISGDFVLWAIPPSLLFGIDRNVMKIEERKSRSLQVFKSGTAFTIQEKESDSISYKVIIREDKHGSLNCDCNTLPKSLCCHVIAILNNMQEKDRNEDLHRLSMFVRQLLVKSLNINPKSSAGLKATKRKGKSISRGNTKRTIGSVLEATLFIGNEEESTDARSDSPHSQDATPAENESHGSLVLIGDKPSVQLLNNTAETFSDQCDDGFSFNVFEPVDASTPKVQVERTELVSHEEETDQSLDEDRLYGENNWDNMIRKAAGLPKRVRKPKRSWSPA